MPFGLPDTTFNTRLRPNAVKHAQFAKWFFDRAVVMRMVDKKTLKVLSRFGYFTMRDARQSIRRRKNTSRPGQPPTNWSGLLKRFIFFSYEHYRRSVIIGPALLPSARNNVPLVLEDGGLVYPIEGKRPVRIQPRPYMEPAFQRQLKKQMPDLWAF